MRGTSGKQREYRCSLLGIFTLKYEVTNVHEPEVTLSLLLRTTVLRTEYYTSEVDGRMVPLRVRP